MAALVILAVVVLVLAVRARRPALAEPLPMLPEDYTGPMVVKAPRAGRLAASVPPPADRTNVAA